MSDAKQWSLTMKAIRGSAPQYGTTATDEKSILGLAAEKLTQPALAVLWQNDAIIFGRFAAGGFDFAAPEKVCFEQLQELRIFNNIEELYVSANSWRYRCDNEAGTEQFDVVDTASRLWGERTDCEVKDGYTCLRDEKRKLELVVPFAGAADKKYLELAIRSYVGYAEATGQAGYVDYRYMDIIEGRE